MIVIMVMMVVIMIVVMVMMVVNIIIVMIVVIVMMHVGGHDTRQADRSMGVVVAVPGLSRGMGGRERHSAEASGGGDSESQHSFTVHEANSF